MFKFLNKKPFVWIFAVFAIALFFRFYLLTKYPVSLSMDEVAIGVNAYSILKTGHDEHGQFLPLAFKSVGDFKPPVQIYLTVISEFIFGFNEFSVRAPVALAGALTVVVFILLLRQLKVSWPGSIFGGLWFSVLPWHIHFSRGGFEAITALLFLVSGTYFFLSWLGKKNIFMLILSIVTFSLSVWAYHSERFFVPVLMVFLIVSYWKEIHLKVQKIQRQALLGLLVLLVFAVPFINLAVFTPAIAQRAAVTSILRETSLAQSLHQGNYTDLAQRLLDNDSFLIFRHWAGKYLNYFDLRLWFWEGLQFTPPGYADVGLLLAVDLPLFLFGIYSLARSQNQRLKTVALFWFFAGPLAASFTMNEQHPLRALIWIPFFGFIMASAAETLLPKIKKYWYLGAFYFILLAGNLIYFGDIYIHHFPRFYAESWQYGFKQAAEYSCKNIMNYDKVLISDTFGINGPLNTGLPYLYVLFYCPGDMENFLTTGEHLSKFNFRRPNDAAAKEKGKLLLIGSPWDFLDGNIYGGKVINKVIYPGGEDAFIFVEKQ